MGITSVFSWQADLRGLLNSAMPLRVSEVIHKATIEINEEHTVAAAATSESC